MKTRRTWVMVFTAAVQAILGTACTADDKGGVPPRAGCRISLWRARPPAQEDDFGAYYTSRGDHLRYTAFLLCGDRHFAEDLTQIVFIKLYQAWHRIERHEVMDRYARKVLLRTFLDERRRPWRRKHAPEPSSSTLDNRAHHDPLPDERLALQRALLRLPSGTGRCSCCGSGQTFRWNSRRQFSAAPPER